ncbi:sigma-70 family RNA polymerase sigma factor [Paenibacillus terricola]|nr:sigma-70 family RNA polymerase sigma factor [Paenibacillus terricola]
MIDKKLVRAAKEGDVEAFTVLVSTYSNVVHAASYQVVLDYYLAQDIAQETFVRAWYNLSQLENEETLGNWLYTIARRLSLDWLRKYRTKQVDSYSDLVDMRSEHTVEDAVLRNEKVEKVHQAFNQLDENHRNVVYMYFISGFNTREISEVLDISSNTVESRLRRAKLKMKKGLFEMAAEVLTTHKVDNQFSQRVKARIKAMITIDMHVSDLKKSLHFYVEMLGFELVRPPFHPDQDIEDNAIIRIEGGPNIILVKKRDSHNIGRSSIVFTYHTDDIEAVYALLRENGVRTNDRYDDGCGQWFECFDPDGNLVNVHSD